MPKLVSEWTDQCAKDYLVVHYSRLNALTMVAIKELTEEIGQMKERLTGGDRFLREENRAAKLETLERRGIRKTIPSAVLLTATQRQLS